jgi:hypothetical protein
MELAVTAATTQARHHMHSIERLLCGEMTMKMHQLAGSMRTLAAASSCALCCIGAQAVSLDDLSVEPRKVVTWPTSDYWSDYF